MAHRRLLMVSWLFPPHASIGAKRAYRFARHLPAAGWLPTVLCRRRPPPGHHDPSAWPLPPGAAVVRAYDSPMLSFLADRGGRAVAPPRDAGAPLERSGSRRLRDRFDRFVDALVPTETAAIHGLHAARVLASLAPGHDAIWTTSYPSHAHLLGMRAARRFALPFVADLRDPWALNWVHQAKLPHARWVERRLEAAVFAAADAVVVTTEALADAYRRRYPALAARFVAIHNAFDPLPGGRRPRPPGAPATLVHFGNVYGPWSLGTVFRALRRLREGGELPPAGVALENYGRLSDADRAIAREQGVADLVRVHAPLPYGEGVERLRSADLLLLAAWDAPDARLYIQGKLYDYLLAASPVLAETGNPEVAGILARTGAGVVIGPGDVDGAVRALRHALAGTLTRTGDPSSVEYFSAPAAARRLGALLDRVLAGR